MRRVRIGILWSHVNSYKNLARDICEVNQWECDITAGGPFSPYVLIGKFDIFIGSSIDMHIGNVNADVYYITVEGDINKLFEYKLKSICNNKYCISVTKWGAEILERHGIKVADVIHHALPLPAPDSAPMSERTYDVIYLNGTYLVQRGIKTLDRKGWGLWPVIASRFPNSRGYTTTDFLNLPKYLNYDGDYSKVADMVIRYNSMTIGEIYRLYESAKVFTNLSYNEGFGLNPLMALSVGTNLVAWDLPVFRELYSGIEGVYLVPANSQFKCSLINPLLTIDCASGDIEEYISAVERALNSWSLSDWQTIRHRFDPYRLYTKFAEYLTG